MQGGYNIETLIAALDVEALAPMAADKLSFTILMFDSFHDVEVRPGRLCSPRHRLQLKLRNVCLKYG